MVSILCVHGIGHSEADQNFQDNWTKSLRDALNGVRPGTDVDVDFLLYDKLFEEGNNPATYAEAFARLMGSCIKHGLGDLFGRRRGLLDIPERLHWTIGMVARWVSDEGLKASARKILTDRLKEKKVDVVFAHSLGSLISYDTFTRNQDLLEGRTFISCGSQIGNECVREAFDGRLPDLDKAKAWFHLYNPNDHVFTAPIPLSGLNFHQVDTTFDEKGDMLNHSVTCYISHANAAASVWREVAGMKTPKFISATRAVVARTARKPNRRALLVGINDYPDPANQLHGCVNDVFLMSSVLQECGFEAEDIRAVLNERATASGVRDRLQWLLDGTRPGDERVLFYSGHGAQMPSYGPTEEVDAMDECLVTYDFDWTPEHTITDKQFHQLYSQIPYETRFAAIFDCCHSGGMTRGGATRVRGIEPPDDIRHRALRWNSKLQMWENRELRDGERKLGRGTQLRSKSAKGKLQKLRQELGHKGPYMPVLIEACQENQYSYEYQHGVESYGAFTFCLSATLRSLRAAKKNPTFQEIVGMVSGRLKKLGYEQTPNLVGPKDWLDKPIPWKVG